MSGALDKRKRCREEDVSCDSTPLSKRINNLHLSNFEEAHFSHHNHPHQQQEQPHLNINNNNHMHPHLAKEMLMHHQAASASCTSDSNNGAIKTMNGDVAESTSTIYNPELDETDNPFYYNKNKLLHELHLERIKRFSV